VPWRTPDDPDAWIDLNDTEYKSIWDRVDATFDFRPSTKPESWPSFREPEDSVTWDLTPLFSDFLNQYERTELQVGASLREALDLVGADDGYVYALDWQHPGYRFLPSLARPPRRTDSWLVPVIPDGDYYLFLTGDLRSGWLSHPWERSVCVCGDLLPAMAPALDRTDWPVLRRGGRPTNEAK
jgi:hypothetical protein